MEKKHRMALALAGVLALLAGGYFWQGSASGTSVPAAADKAAPPKGTAVVVEASRVVRLAFSDEAIAVGTLKSNESVVLRPEISGRVMSVSFEDGEIVGKGHLLFSLDANIQAAELRQAEAQLALARATQRRNEDLYQKKFISSQALDNSKSTLQVQEANVALALARLEKTRIRAPFAGVLGIRQVSPGDYVREGTDLVNLEDISTLKLDFRMPEMYLRQLRPGLALEVMTDALPEEVFTATLAAIDPLVDENGRSIACRALLDNREGKLRPGMFTRVRLVFSGNGATPDTALAIPEEAVIPGVPPEALRIEEGVARAVSVRLGRRRAGKVEVLEGLREGEMVVTSGQLKVRDGSPVTTMEDSRVEERK
ncbi:MAG: efflux RND transporter periplasmic adaptor subunit [Zoogloeaceae bacterium]|jgi:membrane fusion protein (multidrug efflux system)|nr:efflux RND transporter periplasmic adaptor subunit [Zoogloeaceae bacterium]